jgi:hypothetical protein
MSASTSRPSKVHRPGLAQAVSGVVPPEIAEANIRTVWPSVTEVSRPAANLGAALTRTRVLAPLAWLLMAPLYFKKILPFLAKRYRLTNRRLMVCRGYRPKPEKEVPLDQIKDVRFKNDEISQYYFAGDLEVLGQDGQLLLELPGVREAESFGNAILQAAQAWGPLLKT